MNAQQMVRIFGACLLALLSFAHRAESAVVFSDDFNRANSTVIGSTAGPGTGTWGESITPTVIPTVGGSGDVLISNNLMLVDHNVDDAIYSVSMSTAGFLAPWNNVLSNNPGKVTWTFNMQSQRDNLSGVGPGLNGIGTVLVSNGTTVGATKGYGVFWGNSGATDPVLLLHFDGLASTPMVTGTLAGAPFSDLGTNYLSLKVIYDPATNLWEFYGRDDGSTAFADPLIDTGYVFLGSATDSTHTGITMSHVGMVGAYTANAGSDLYRYDNFTISVIPEPSSIILGVLAIAGVIGLLQRR